MICKYKQAGEREGEPGEEGEGEAEGRITINSSLPALQLYSPVYIYRTKEVGYHELSFFQSCFVAEKDVCEHCKKDQRFSRAQPWSWHKNM
jgi:hypothetical protein